MYFKSPRDLQQQERKVVRQEARKSATINVKLSQELPGQVQVSIDAAHVVDKATGTLDPVHLAVLVDPQLTITHKQCVTHITRLHSKTTCTTIFNNLII